MSGSSWDAAFTKLCNLRCKRGGLGDTACMEICGEAGIDTDTQPTCGEILEALGFENDSDIDWENDE
jgi:hypothetical protein